ncbi:MAG: acyltransferase [Pseudomonadales bacterium]
MKVFRGIVYLLLALPVAVITLLLMTCLALLKLVLPVPVVRRGLTHSIIAVAELWAGTSGLLYRWVNRPKWDVDGLEELSHDEWYLLICNHQSWSDIPVLLFLMNRRIPVFRFFVKQQLIWVPLLGLACWAMEFPFMRRYSREQLEGNPDLRRKDLQETQRFCERMKKRPATIVNYLEGTRFTQQKHDRQSSPYRHLLKPKSGGAAYVVTHLGERVGQMVDVTLVYPKQNKGFWAFLCGDLGRVRVHMQLRAIPQHFKAGDYQESDEFRAEFQQWIADIWQQKDDFIATTLANSKTK